MSVVTRCEIEGVLNKIKKMKEIFRRDLLKPQGTVLGSLLFLLYINDLPDNLSTSVPFFAVDCILYTPIRTQSNCSLLQNDLLKLQKWRDTWLMKFNPGKCYTMTPATRTPTLNIYTFCGQTLKSVDSHCYLGIHLSNTVHCIGQLRPKQPVLKLNKRYRSY